MMTFSRNPTHVGNEAIARFRRSGGLPPKRRSAGLTSPVVSATLGPLQERFEHMPTHRVPDDAKLDRIVAQARGDRERRLQGYREQALRLFPWVCTRCAREFDRANLSLLTVHHRDGDHHHNPADGSNWELLCVYCHENEHAREHDNAGRTASAEPAPPPATHRPFAGLDALLKSRK